MLKHLAAATLGTAVALCASAVLAQPKLPVEKAAPPTPAPAASAAQGRDNALAMCIGCHGVVGYKTAFPSVYHVPKIAGQNPVYLYNALKAYKSGERSHPSMRGIAATLTEEQMKALAEYYGSEK